MSRRSFLPLAIAAAASAFIAPPADAAIFGAPGAVQATPSTPSALAVGDLNRDGRPDLVSADFGGGSGATVTVLLGNGALGWSSVQQYGLGTGRGPVALAVADFDGDGWLDVATANASLSTNGAVGSISRLYGTPAGLGTAATTSAPKGLTGIAAGDVDEDGLPEVGVSIDTGVAPQAGLNVGAIAIAENRNEGFVPTITVPVTNPQNSIVASDVNLDGHVDFTGLATGRSTVGSLSMVLGSGQLGGPGSFTLRNPGSQTNQGNSLVFGMFASDGWQGFAYARPVSGTNTVQVRTLPVSPFVRDGLMFANGRTNAITVGDYNGDGKLDQVSGRVNTDGSSANLINWTIGYGIGATGPCPGGGPCATPREEVAVSDLGKALATADFNADGRPDVAVAVANGVRIVPNVGDPAVTGVGAAVISEFRFDGASSRDQYVQITNRSMTENLSVGGWTLKTSNGREVPIRQGVVIPRGGRLLFGAGATVNSLSASGTPEIALPRDAIPTTGGGVALVGPTGATIDAAGLTGAPEGFREGAGVNPVAQLGTRAYVRKFAAGLPQDTGDNAADFVAVDTGANGTTSALLGAPRPDGASAPSARNDFLQSSLIDAGAGAENAPNRVVTPAANGNPATITFNRRITNCSGTGKQKAQCANAPTAAAVTATRLRFRITALSTVGTPGNGAILKAVTSSTQTYGGTTVQGLPLDGPSTPGAGGFNSTLTATPLLPIDGLTEGGELNVAFTFTVQRSGKFTFAFNTEDDVVPAGLLGNAFPGEGDEPEAVGGPVGLSPGVPTTAGSDASVVTGSVPASVVAPAGSTPPAKPACVAKKKPVAKKKVAKKKPVAKKKVAVKKKSAKRSAATTATPACSTSKTAAKKKVVKKKAAAKKKVATKR